MFGFFWPVSVNTSLTCVHQCVCLCARAHCEHSIRASEGFWDASLGPNWDGYGADRNWCQVLGPLWKQEAAHRCTGAVVGLCSTQIQFVPNKPTQGSTS